MDGTQLVLISTDALEEVARRSARLAVDQFKEEIKAAPPVREIMTKAELADYLRCSVSKVNAYMREGLPFVTFGEHPRFRKSEIDRWLDRGQEASNAAN
jgi:excisionase family DNA binding protein